MDRRMKDYMMTRGMGGRDRRNPYGSRGGYVTNRRPDRGMDRGDYRRGEDRGMDREDYRRGMDRGDYRKGEDRGGYRRQRDHDNYREDMNRDYAGMGDFGHGGWYEGEFRGMTRDHDMMDGRRGGGRDRGMDRGEDYRRDRDYGDYADYGQDYGQDYEQDYGGGYLNRDELEHWEHKLMEELDKSEKDSMSREKIIKRAKDLGIKFDEYTEDELAVATLVMYTDYCKTLGKASIDMYVKLAKDFLEDKDAGVRYGEKLAAYFDHIVNV